MALLHLHPHLLMFLFAIAFSVFDFSAAQHVKAKISCLDCDSHYDFSGIIIAVKCDKVKKLATATTDSEGSFEVELPLESAATANSNCLAKLMGGTTQIYATKKNMVSNTVKSLKDPNSYTISSPLAFSTSSKNEETGHNLIDESKTYDLPLPKEWGLAPSSYYFPFFPIIGIP